MRAMKAVVLAYAASMFACAPTPRVHEVNLKVSVKSDDGAPLARVAVLVDDTPIGHTDARGEMTAIVQSRLARARVQVACPEGYRPAEARILPLVAAEMSTLSLDVPCRPRERRLAVVVQAPGGAGLPVLADGVVLGAILEDETAHFVLQREPGVDLRLAIDTSRVARLQPPQPVRQIRVPDRNDVVIFEQRFSTPPAPKRVSPRASPSEPKNERHVPYAISTGR